MNVPDSRVAVAFHLALYLDVGAALNYLDGIATQVDVVFLVLLVPQGMLTELVHLINQL